MKDHPFPPSRTRSSARSSGGCPNSNSGKIPPECPAAEGHLWVNQSQIKLFMWCLMELGWFHTLSLSVFVCVCISPILVIRSFNACTCTALYLAIAFNHFRSAFLCRATGFILNLT
jgi:hypothetical protein